MARKYPSGHYDTPLGTYTNTTTGKPVSALADRSGRWCVRGPVLAHRSGHCDTVPDAIAKVKATLEASHAADLKAGNGPGPIAWREGYA
jgi:hypothetical protein